MKVVDAYENNTLVLFLIVLNGFEHGLRHVFLLFWQRLLASLACRVRVADAGDRNLPVFIRDKLVFNRLHSVRFHSLVRRLIRFTLVVVVLHDLVRLFLTLGSCYVITMSGQLIFRMAQPLALDCT